MSKLPLLPCVPHVDDKRLTPHHGSARSHADNSTCHPFDTLSASKSFSSRYTVHRVPEPLVKQPTTRGNTDMTRLQPYNVYPGCTGAKGVLAHVVSYTASGSSGTPSGPDVVGRRFPPFRSRSVRAPGLLGHTGLIAYRISLRDAPSPR